MARKAGLATSSWLARPIVRICRSRIGIEPLTHADRHIEAFLDQVHPAVGDHHLKVEAGELAQELRQFGREPAIRCRRAADANPALGLGFQLERHLLDGLGFRQSGARVAVDVLTDSGDAEPPGRALE